MAKKLPPSDSLIRGTHSKLPSVCMPTRGATCLYLARADRSLYLSSQHTPAPPEPGLPGKTGSDFGPLSTAAVVVGRRFKKLIETEIGLENCTPQRLHSKTAPSLDISVAWLQDIQFDSCVDLAVAVSTVSVEWMSRRHALASLQGGELHNRWFATRPCAPHHYWWA